MAIQEKDIVLRILDKNGNTTIGKPITRLTNVEADAEIKENPTDNDYVPIIDTNDSEQMKKTPISAVKNTASTITPKVAGTAAVGTDTGFARGDHVHPAQTSISGNAGTATKLKTARTIDGVSFDGSANIMHYGTCSTAAATAAKVVTLTGFVLDTGAEATVKFTVTNTAANPTLNVNNTGAKAIYYRGAAIAAGYLAANRTYSFRYNGTQYDLVGDIDTNTTYTVATTAKNGLMSAADKTKLDGVETGANAYTHPDTSGNKHIPAGGSSGQILRWSADGTATWGADNNTTYSNMTAATASAAGKAGLVPAPAAGKQTSFLRGDGTWMIPTNTTYAAMTGATASAAGTAGLVPAPAKGAQAKYLRGDGTWQTPPDTTYTVATSDKDGLMSKADKEKLDSLSATSPVSMSVLDQIYEKCKGSFGSSSFSLTKNSDTNTISGSTGGATSQTLKLTVSSLSFTHWLASGFKYFKFTYPTGMVSLKQNSTVVFSNTGIQRDVSLDMSLYSDTYTMEIYITSTTGGMLSIVDPRVTN